MIKKISSEFFYILYVYIVIRENTEVMYMYPIKINIEPQMVSYEKKFDLGYDSTLTLSQLLEFGVTNENSFQIIEEENTQRYTLYINGKRIETKQETEIRVKREEAYMKGYIEFHSRNKK